MGRTTNDAGRALIKSHEGLRLAAYPDPASGGDPWTIGYGHSHGVAEGDTCCVDEAESFLTEDLQIFEAGVSNAATVPLTDNQFSALVSFAFNLGLGRLRGSTLLRMLNTHDYQGAAEQFLVWCGKDGSACHNGLLARRTAERALFLQPGTVEA